MEVVRGNRFPPSGLTNLSAFGKLADFICKQDESPICPKDHAVNDFHVFLAGFQTSWVALLVCPEVPPIPFPSGVDTSAVGSGEMLAQGFQQFGHAVEGGGSTRFHARVQVGVAGDLGIVHDVYGHQGLGAQIG